MVCSARLGVMGLALALSALGNAAASIPMEHSLDGGASFVPAGVITIDRTGAAATLERPPLDRIQEEQLAQLVANDGMYRLRLPSGHKGSSQAVSTSFPARCLPVAVADAGMALELLDGGLVAGIAINAPCSRGNVAASGGVQLPSSQALQLRVPLAAPDVLQLLASSQQAPLPGGAAAGVHPSDPVAQQGQGAGQDQQAEAQQKQGQAGKPKAKEEEKTWLQKNWMIMMPLGFIIMNLLGGGAERQQRAGGGGAAPVRAVPARR